jgi:hypothetical protein
MQRRMTRVGRHGSMKPRESRAVAAVAPLGDDPLQPHTPALYFM